MSVAERPRLKKGYSADRKFKRCHGPLHPEGVMLSVKAFSGDNGILTSWCRRCRTYQANGNENNIFVPSHCIEPIHQFLRFHLGTNVEICRRIGVERGFFSRPKESRRGKIVRAMCDLAMEVARERGITCRPGADRSVVRSEPLGEILREWEFQWLSDHGYVEGVNESISYGPITFLHEKTGIGHKKISLILKSGMPLVCFSDTDRLLSAIQRQELLSMDEIPVLHNPDWSPKQHIRELEAQGLI